MNTPRGPRLEPQTRWKSTRVGPARRPSSRVGHCHMPSDHPELLEQISDQQILDWIAIVAQRVPLFSPTAGAE